MSLISGKAELPHTSVVRLTCRMPSLLWALGPQGEVLVGIAAGSPLIQTGMTETPQSSQTLCSGPVHFFEHATSLVRRAALQKGFQRPSKTFPSTLPSAPSRERTAGNNVRSMMIRCIRVLCGSLGGHHHAIPTQQAVVDAIRRTSKIKRKKSANRSWC